MYTFCVTGQHTQLDLSHSWLPNTEIFIVFLLLIFLIFFLLIFALYVSVRRPSGRPFRAIYPSEQEDPVSYDPYGLSVWAGFSWGTYCTYIPLPLTLWDDSIVAVKKISILFFLLFDSHFVHVLFTCLFTSITCLLFILLFLWFI